MTFTPDTVALIGIGVSIMVYLVRISYKLGQLETKIDTLWQCQIRDHHPPYTA